MPPIDPSDPRPNRLEQNSMSLLELLAQRGPITLADLKRHVLLKQTSIFNTLTQLARAKLVVSERSAPSGLGRPVDFWSLDAQAGCFLLVHFANFHNYYQLCDFCGEVLVEVEREANTDLNEAIAQAREVADELLAEHGGAGRSLEGLIVCLSGAVNAVEGELTASTRWNLKRFALREALTDAFEEHQPLIEIANDARAAAWGEKCSGQGQHCQHLLNLLITGVQPGLEVGIALGIGMVFDEKIYHGHQGLAGETDFLVERWQEQTAHHKLLCKLDELTNKEVESLAEAIGERFAHMVNLLAPERVVVNFIEHETHASFVHFFGESLGRHLVLERDTDFRVMASQLHRSAIFAGCLDILRSEYFQPSPGLLTRVRTAYEGCEDISETPTAKK